MISTDRVVDLATALLPIDQLKQALLPPVRLAREGAVVAARTTRHWELALGGEDTTTSSAPGTDRDESPRDEVSDVDLRTEQEAPASASDLPVDNWPALSFADAQARLAGCDEDDLRTLLAYEQAHGHRLQYTQLLEQRLAHGA